MYKEDLSRRIFFWILAIVFWVFSAVFVGYAFGYRFSLERGIFVYAGSITFKTTPQEIEIYLNGELVPSPSFNMVNSTYHVSGIAPGDYLVEIRAKDHQTWSKKVTVHSGISTEFWNVILAQNSYENTKYDSAGIQRFFISPRKNLTAIAGHKDDALFIKVLDPESLEISEIFSSSEYAFTDDEKENIEWTPEAKRLIVPVLKDGKKNYLIMTIETKEFFDLATYSGSENLSHVRWDPKNKDILFYMSGNDLYRMDIESPQEKKLVAQNIGSYDLSPKALFYFQLPEGIVYKTNFDASDSSQQITKSPPENMNDKEYQITVYDENRIAFLNKNNGYLYIYNVGIDDLYFHKLSENARGSQFSDDGKKLLYWTDREIFTYFVRKWDVQPKRIENEKMHITSFFDEISNVQWTRDYEHVIFVNNGMMKFIEIDNRDNRNMMDIVSLKNNGSVAINNFADGKIYYTEKNEDGENYLHSMYFPEYSTLLEELLPGNQEMPEN